MPFFKHCDHFIITTLLVRFFCFFLGFFLIDLPLFLHVVFENFNISGNFYKRIDKLQIPITDLVVKISDPLLNNKGSLSTQVASHVSRFHVSSFPITRNRIESIFVWRTWTFAKVICWTQNLFSNIFIFFFCPLGTINIWCKILKF